MTEKRFTITGDRSISDHHKKRLYDLSDFDGVISVTECLNELHEENQALKTDRARYEEECRLDIFKELYEENEQLKQEIDYWKKRALLSERKEMCKQYNETIR